MFGGISVLEADFRSDKGIQISFMLLTGVLFWRSISGQLQRFDFDLRVCFFCFGVGSPNRQVHSSELYVVDRSAVLEVDLRTVAVF